MSDLEQRLTEALTHGAQGAPPAIGLADAARNRARSKRRTRLAGVAAVVALGVGLPTAVLASGGTHDADPSPAPAGQDTATDPAAQGEQLPGGFHYESWHGVTIEVPDSWTYGAPASWCAGGGAVDPPRIGRPGGVTESIACSPASGYGVTFQAIDNTDDFSWPLERQDQDSWPADAYVGARGLGGTLVEVALPDLALAQQILDSARTSTFLDPNGCPVDATSDPVVPGQEMTVCRYDAQGLLEQSELISGADVAAVESALRAAPATTTSTCRPHSPASQTIRLASVAEDATIDLGCGQLAEHGESRVLTPEVLYWALSPGWSGSVPDGVSLPSVLRTP